MAPIQGWYDDPTDAGRLRWWDGSAWTERTRPAGPAHAEGDGLDDVGSGQAAAGATATGGPSGPGSADRLHLEHPEFALPSGGDERVTLPGGDPFDLRGTKIRILIAILVVATLALLAAVALAGLGRGNIFAAEVGDCFDGEASAEVSDVQFLDCDDPHDHEVFDAFDASGDEYPGRATIEQLAVDGCHDRFRAVVGYPVDLTDLDVSTYFPTEDSWQDGDREVLCILFRFDGEPLVGSRIGLAASRGQQELRLREGDCFDAPLREPGASPGVPGVAIVDCAVPHFAEVYEVVSLPEGPNPGREALAAAAQDRCHAAFEPFVGEPFEESAVLWFNALPPTAGSWEDGDRDVVCYVYDVVNGQMIGPAPQWAQQQREAAADFGAGYDVTFLSVGDCFDDPVGDTVPAVDCADPHDNEAFLVLDLEGDEWPGRAALEAEVTIACSEAFEDWVGPDRDDLAWFPFQPTQATWDAGDRRVVCALYDIDFLKLTGSQKRAAV